MDELVDPAQPEGEGQGGETTGGSPWESYLDRIPENARDAAASAFKEMEAEATRKFQEHADFRKQWEPYEQSGIRELTPEMAQWLAQFGGALDNPQAIQEWFNGYAQQHNLQTQQPAELEPEFPEYEDQSTQQIQKLLEQQLSPLSQQLQEFAQWRQLLETGAREAQAKELVDQQLSEIRSKHPNEFNQVAEQAIEALLPAYMESDPQNAVNNAWAKYRELRNALEKQTLQTKANLAGGGAESGGLADGSPDEIHTLKEASPIAREAIKRMFQQ